MLNGRYKVTFGAFNGMAGVVVIADKIEVAFMGKPPRVGATGEIDGKPYCVVTSARSEFVPGMAVITVMPDGGGVCR
ncbi:MAG: hypothetical protein IPO08_19815 [Xanthomonadales bacterium]|nr:hypothetical protein [Xanthomonadales bacterium]